MTQTPGPLQRKSIRWPMTNGSKAVVRTSPSSVGRAPPCKTRSTRSWPSADRTLTGRRATKSTGDNFIVLSKNPLLLDIVHTRRMAFIRHMEVA